jgi:AcrR family transcriptional regulator
LSAAATSEVFLLLPAAMCIIKPTGWYVFEAPMTTQSRSEETKAHILDAALGCFSERGYDATGVAEICQRAGVSKGAFYYHFASKQAVFVALLEQWLVALDREMAALAALTAPSATAVQSLQAMVGLLQRVFRDARGRLPMFLEFWRQAAHDEVIWRATMAPFARYHVLLAGVIDQGIGEGSLRPCDAREAARALVSMAVGMVLQSALDAAGNDWERSAQAGVDLLLHGLTQHD